MVRLILSLAMLSAASAFLVPTASPRSQDKKVTIKILSRTQVAIPHDLVPKGRENKGDWISYKALLLTVGPLFGKKHKNQPVGFEAPRIARSSRQRRARAATCRPRASRTCSPRSSSLT